MFSNISSASFTYFKYIHRQQYICKGKISSLSGPSIRRKVGYTCSLLVITVIEDITFGPFRIYVTLYRFSWTRFILDLALNYTDKLMVFRWIQTVLIL